MIYGKEEIRSTYPEILSLENIRCIRFYRKSIINLQNAMENETNLWYNISVSKYCNTRTGKGLAPNSVNAVVLVLHASLTMAYALGLTKAVHVDKIKRPTVREKPVESFTTEEQKLIEQAVLADRRPKMFGIVLCLYTGLRIGELLALEWSDVNLSEAELYVTKSCYDGKGEDGQFCRITGTPKTESSRRVIPIPKQLIPHLRELKKKSNSKHVVSDGAKVITVRSYQRSFCYILLCFNIRAFPQPRIALPLFLRTVFSSVYQLYTV